MKHSRAVVPKLVQAVTQIKGSNYVLLPSIFHSDRS